MILKRIIPILLLSLVSLFCQAKYYLAHVTANVNLREAPSTDSNVLSILLKGAQILYSDEACLDGFCNVLFIEKDIYGYVSSQYIKLDKELEVNENGMLQVVGQTENMPPSIEIHNDTDIKLSLKIGERKYSFSPHEKRTIVSEAGTFDIIASSPGVIPLITKYTVENNYEYEWQFCIKTTIVPRRK